MIARPPSSVGKCRQTGPEGHRAISLPRPVTHRAAVIAAAGTRSTFNWYDAAANSTPSAGNKVSAGIPLSHRQQPGDWQANKRRSSTRSQQQCKHSTSAISNNDHDDDLQGPGWWEVPREVRAAKQAAAADLVLEPWQEEALLIAAASSKKKLQVQTLAANLGFDRSEVLAWLATFRAKPKQQQEQLLAPLQQQIQRQQEQQQQIKQQEQQKRQQQQQQAAHSSSGQPGANQQLPLSSPNPNTGFVPYADRRAGGAVVGSQKGRRLPAEVLRTLEGVYDRSPWPSKEVVAGLFDLHRLPREVVLHWFEARRDMNNLPHNPRQAKKSGITAAAAAAAVAGQPLPVPLLDLQQPTGNKPQQIDALKQQQQRQQWPSTSQQISDQVAEAFLDSRARTRPGAATAANIAPQQKLQQSGQQQQPPPPPQQQQQQQQQRPAAVPLSRVTARGLAALKSSFPSPKKLKGARLTKELGITSGAEAKQHMQISGITFVTHDGSSAWQGVWRRWHATKGLPAQRVDFDRFLLHRYK